MTDQHLPTDEAVHCIRYIHGPEINDWPPEDIIKAYLTDTDEGRALVRDAERLRNVIAGCYPDVNAAIARQRARRNAVPDDACEDVAMAAIARQEGNRET